MKTNKRAGPNCKIDGKNDASMVYATRVNSNGNQLYIPIDIREKLKLLPKTSVLIRIEVLA